MYTGSSFTLTPHAAAAAAAAPAPHAAKHDFTFSDFLSIINPLQHLPVVSTLYRAITGDTIKAPEKIMGDTLYGGPLSGLSAIADTIYQQQTGKSFGDTVLGWLGFGHHDAAATNVAKTSDPLPAPATLASTQTPAPTDTNVTALSAALSRNGVTGDVAQRALYAYRRSFTGAAPSMIDSY
jgi:hypothetical protein